MGWAVLRPDGEVWWYGDHPDGSQLDSSGYRRVGDPSGPANIEIVSEWYLHHVQDRDGNLVTFYPEWDFGDGNDPVALQGVPEVRLRAISWAERSPGATYAHDPGGDSLVGFSTGVQYGVQGAADWLGAVESGAFLQDPGAFFPSGPGQGPEGSGPHYYAAVVGYEARPDQRVSHGSGVPMAGRGRISDVTIYADATVDFHPKDLFGLHGNADTLRSWVLQYDEGTTGKSRLTRVWPLVGAAGLPSAAPPDGRGTWDTTGSSVQESPWEIAWSDSSTLDPANPAIPASPTGGPHDVSPDGSDPFWFQEGFIDGGFNLSTLIDLNGDGLPDQLEHAPDLLTLDVQGDVIDFVSTPILDELANLSAFTDHFPPLLSDPFFQVRWNVGDGAWSAQEQGPLNPFSLYATGDVQIVSPVCTNPDPTGCAMPSEFSSLLPTTQITEGVGFFCEGAAVAQAFDIAGIPVPAPEWEARMAWCEYRSCAPFCETETAVTVPWHPHSHPASNWAWMSTDWETVRPSEPDPRLRRGAGRPRPGAASSTSPSCCCGRSTR